MNPLSIICGVKESRIHQIEYRTYLNRSSRPKRLIITFLQHTSNWGIPRDRAHLDQAQADVKSKTVLFRAFIILIITYWTWWTRPCLSWPLLWQSYASFPPMLKVRAVNVAFYGVINIKIRLSNTECWLINLWSIPLTTIILWIVIDPLSQHYPHLWGHACNKKVLVHMCLVKVVKVLDCEVRGLGFDPRPRQGLLYSLL